MDAALAPLALVERLGRHGEVLERWRLPVPAGGSVCIGRDLHADVLLLDDPHVALLHAHLQRDADGALQIADAGSLNGVIDDASGRRAALWPIAAQRVFRIGGSRLRIHDGRALQEPERALPQPVARAGLRAFGWLLLAMGSSLLADWLEQVGEVRSSALLTALLAGTLLLLAWSFAWSLVTRLFGGELRFLRHLRVIAIGSLLASLLMAAVQYLGYGLLLEPLARYAYVGYWLLFAAICYAHLRVLGDGHRRLKAAVMLGMALVAIGLQSLALWQPRGGEDRSLRYVRSVVVPAFRLRPLQDVDTFFTRAAALQADLDAARADDARDDADADAP